MKKFPVWRKKKFNDSAHRHALGQTQQVSANLETLQLTIASQPDPFKVSWTFEGTKHFIRVEPQLARYREWLLQLFAAVEIEDGREAILAALQEVRGKFIVLGER
ncbi:MAG: hypothetical protein ONB45_24505 [candidate division KSB1 bacterium]|nr:hypothetical protein [candidate division KSB1 bacterium]